MLTFILRLLFMYLIEALMLLFLCFLVSLHLFDETFVIDFLDVVYAVEVKKELEFVEVFFPNRYI